MGEAKRKQEARQDRKKVAIIGFTESRKDAPFDDPEFERWGLNGLFTYKDVRNFDRWFDLHRREVIDEGRLDWYRETDIPVYLQDAWDDVPGSVRFPVEDLREAFGNYFTNSISWMIAFAIHEGFEEIHVYGVDMSQDVEYRFQRPNLEYFLGLAEGMGVKTYVPPVSDLLAATHEYGYGSDGGFRAKLKAKLKEHEGRIKHVENELQRLGNIRAATMAGLEVFRAVDNDFKSLSEQDRETVADQVKQHEDKITEIDKEVRRLQGIGQTLEGARQACEWAIQSWGVADHTSMESLNPAGPSDERADADLELVADNAA